jgi:MarR family transcriptional regulator for hemolysin
MPVMQPTARRPIGLSLALTAKAVSRAFDEAMTEAGASLPVWLTLLSIRTRRASSQREIAEAIGIQGATLTHHLNRMEAEGLVTRRRDPANRRMHQVELTPAGEAMFHRLVATATAFDRRLREGFDDGELALLERLLVRLRGNVDVEG